jgi:2-polyprenyl-6-methoxyphenol hydroxylase-like FAD-dependent oxidoreductase
MTTPLTTTCCIAGGGPAGMMAGFLLARAGIDVTVLEKHGDFFRDFRGDTVHPSTLQIVDELGLLDEFLRRPHDEVRELSAQIGTDRLIVADFSRLRTHCNFIALMPQWDFLDFIADHAERLPNFHLRMNCEATGLIETAGAVTGVRTTQGDIAAALTIAADGRHSVLRAAAGLTVEDFAAPMDVLWFRVARQPGDSAETFGHAEAGRLMIMLNRTTYWQCAYVIAKGSADALRRQPITTFRDAVEAMAPMLRDRLTEIATWDDAKLLTVTVDRLKRWSRPGLLAIGDAAHAMSPIGGVGINLAIQDAVAAANLLADPLRAGAVSAADLEAVQDRREFPVKVVQRVQIAIQRQVLGRLLARNKPLRAPRLLRALAAIPALRALPAYFVGIGVRPEHVRVTGSG